MIVGKGRKESAIESTNFHDLQFTLHLVVVAVLFEPLLEVVDLGGLKYCASGGDPENLNVSIYQSMNFTGILLAFLLQRLLVGMYQYCL